MNPRTLITAFLIIECVQAFILGVLLCFFYRTYRRNYLLLWAISWLSYCIFYLGGITGYYLAQSLPVTHPARLINALIYIPASYLQIPCLFIGAYELTKGKSVSPKLTRNICLLALLVGMCFVILSTITFAPVGLRSWFRVGTHFFITGVVLLVAAFGTIYLWNPKPNFGRICISIGFFGYGFFNLVLGFFATSLISNSQYLISYLHFLDSVVQFWFGLSLVVSLLEEEREKATAAARALQTSESLFRKLTEHNSAAIFILQENKIVYMNPSGAAITRYETDELLGKSINDLAHLDFKNLSLNSLGLNEDENTRPRYEIKLINKEGEECWLDASTTRIEYKGHSAILMTAIDVTERKHAEELLLQSQKLESIGRLAGGIAHDFNNILTGIIGYIEITLLKVSVTDPVVRNLEQIKKLSLRAADLTSQLLAFARKQVLQAKVVDINELIQETVSFLNRLIGENIKIELILDENLSAVKADSMQIQQVLTNIALNARDAMPNGGQLSFSTRNAFLDEEFCQQYSYLIAGDYVEIIIRDTGLGMSSEVQGRIFEPFYTTKEMGRGTGLGLAMVYGIIKQHGGYIFVESGEGKGTVFTIYMPASVSETKVHKVSFSGLPTTGSETILLVEDEQSVRDLIGTSLSEEGYRVLIAEDGEVALKLFQENAGKIDLVISDVVMPKIGGQKLLETLRHKYPELKFLFISGYGIEDTDNGFNKLGAELLRKPFNPNELARKVRQVLNQPVKTTTQT